MFKEELHSPNAHSFEKFFVNESKEYNLMSSIMIFKRKLTIYLPPKMHISLSFDPALTDTFSGLNHNLCKLVTFAPKKKAKKANFLLSNLLY